MRGSKSNSLSTLLSSAMKMNPKPIPIPKTLEAIAEEAEASSALTTFDDSTLKLFVSSIDPKPAVEPSNTSEVSALKKKKKKKKKEKESPDLSSLANIAFSAVKSKTCLDSGEELPPSVDTKQDYLTNKISSILIADALENQELAINYEPKRRELDIPWMPSLSHNVVSLRRKDVIRDRKLKWVFSSSQSGRFNRLVNMCTDRVGSDTAFDLFGKLGRESGVKEYTAFLKVCIETARLSKDEDIILNQIHRAFQIFKSMKEHGFLLEEITYGPFLSFLIETEMAQEFFFFCEIIEDVNPSTSSNLGYYEMLLWIELEADEKIQELCNQIVAGEGEQSLIENYLLALCEGGRDKEILQLLKTLDVTKFTSTKSIAAIFKLLGKLQRSDLLTDFFLALKDSDFGSEDLSNFICCYAVGDPKLSVEDVILKFKNLHTKLEVKPSSESYKNLINHSCELQEVGPVLDLYGELFEDGVTVSMDTIHHILRMCEATYNFILVRRVYSLICDYNLAATAETFRLMISLCVKMKDTVTAQKMVKNMEEMNLVPTSNIYNLIISGCLREDNRNGAVMVLNQMGKAEVCPDSMTFAQIISKCDSEEDIDKFWELLTSSGVQTTKAVFMALIHAYTTCGLFEKAKEVINDKSIPVKNLNEIKSVLVQDLVSRGQLSDALQIHEEIKQAGYTLEPRAAISIMEHYNSDGGSSTLLKLLEELTDPDYWLDGATRVITYCIRYKDLSPAIDLLKKLKDKLYVDNELVLEAILDQVFCVIGDLESTHLQIGLDLLRVVKEDLGLTPPRKCLDFLLHACVAAKDLDSSRLVWKEYDAAGLPHNIISYLRMYQALLASGDHKAAKIVLTKIPKDDPHVRYIMKACQTIYAEPNLPIKKKKTLEKKC